MISSGCGLLFWFSFGFYISLFFFFLHCTNAGGKLNLLNLLCRPGLYPCASPVTVNHIVLDLVRHSVSGDISPFTYPSSRHLSFLTPGLFSWRRWSDPPPLPPPPPQPRCDGGHLLLQLLLGPVHLGSPLRRALPQPGDAGAGARPAHGRRWRDRAEEGQGQEEEERKEGEERKEEEGATQGSRSEWLLYFLCSFCWVVFLLFLCQEQNKYNE